ncbi:unnamed protein product [Diamesa serratosioi]
MIPSLVRLLNQNVLKSLVLKETRRTKVTFRSGAMKPMPLIQPFGMTGIIFTVVPGLLIGALISKNIANFLEENDLFVPSDDDEDD